MFVFMFSACVCVCVSVCTPPCIYMWWVCVFLCAVEFCLHKLYANGQLLFLLLLTQTKIRLSSLSNSIAMYWQIAASINVVLTCIYPYAHSHSAWLCSLTVGICVHYTLLARGLLTSQHTRPLPFHQNNPSCSKETPIMFACVYICGDYDDIEHSTVYIPVLYNEMKLISERELF